MPQATYLNNRLGLAVAAVFALALLVGACEPTPTPAPAVTDTPTPAPATTDTPTPGIPAALLEAQDSGAMVWIEFPYNGQILPNEAITLVVYASSAGGVAAISLAVNGQAQPAGSLTDHSTDGSMNLVSIEQAWQPAGEGEYLLTAGADGASAQVTFCVVTCSSETPTGTPTPAPDLTESTTPTPNISDTPTATSIPGSTTSITFWAEPTSVEAGGCTTLNWETTGFKTVYLNEAPVNAGGSDQECPCETTVYTLTGVKEDTHFEDRQVTITVSGSCDVPITEPPLDEPPADTDGPEYGEEQLVWESCDFYGQARILDASGVSWAKFHYNLDDGGWLSLWMQNIGGETWQAEVGISVADGIGTPPLERKIEYKFEAMDEAGNESISEVTLEGYEDCDG